MDREKTTRSTQNDGDLIQKKSAPILLIYLRAMRTTDAYSSNRVRPSRSVKALEVLLVAGSRVSQSESKTNRSEVFKMKEIRVCFFKQIQNG